MTKLTLIDGKMRVVWGSSESGNLVKGESATEGCCCYCSCEKRIVYSWMQKADGGCYTFPSSATCSELFCGCEKWQIVARRTRPQYTGYPRVIASGGIDKATSESDPRCCLNGLPECFYSHLGIKGYEIDYELWVMCAADCKTGVPISFNTTDQCPEYTPPA